MSGHEHHDLVNSSLLSSLLESSPEVIIFALDRHYRYLVFNTKHRETMRAIWGKEIAVGAGAAEGAESDPCSGVTHP